MPSAYIDRIKDLNCVETNGVIRQLTRLATVLDLATDVDYRVLWTALESAGIPIVPSALPGTGFESLMLYTRQARIDPTDNTTCDVTLEYRHVLEGAEELIAQPQQAIAPGIIFGRTRCSVQQFPTNFTPNPTGGPRIPITVQHTFPDGSANFLDPITGLPLPADIDGLAGVTVPQGGQVDGTFPMKNYQVKGVVSGILDPDSIADDFIATVNSKIWRRQPPRTWLCTEVAWEVLGVFFDPNFPIRTLRVLYEFEFQNNPFGWDPYAVFIDARTGRPPVGLVSGVGYKQIQFLPGVDYAQEFGAQGFL